jgi:putative PIN family toxin of toxin-antitoxin system
MPNVVLDANVIVSAALKVHSTSERAVGLSRSRDTLFLSDPVLAEIGSVLRRPKILRAISSERVDRILATLAAAAVMITPLERVRECRDQKDDKYLELALAADARVIVSGDTDLLVMNPWRGIRIISPAEYLRLDDR